MKRTLVFILIFIMIPVMSYGDEVYDLIDKGQRQVQRGRLPTAYATFKKVLVLEPRNSTAMNALAQIASFLELHDESALYYMSYLYLESEYLSDMEEVKKAMAKQERSMSRSAKLKVKVDPMSLEVTVNGLPVANRDFDLPVCADKSYEIAAEMEDYHPYTKTIVVEEGQVKPVMVRLKKIIYKGKVKLRILPKRSGVAIYSDTKKAGTGLNQLELTEGKHLLCFKKEGFDRWWRYVTVPRNDSMDLEVILREQSRPDEPCNVWPSFDD